MNNINEITTVRREFINAEGRLLELRPFLIVPIYRGSGMSLVFWDDEDAMREIAYLREDGVLFVDNTEDKRRNIDMIMKYHKNSTSEDRVYDTRYTIKYNAHIYGIDECGWLYTDDHETIFNIFTFENWKDHPVVKEITLWGQEGSFPRI